MKRILLITTIFHPQIGGPATFIERLAYALTDTGERVTVLCATPNPDPVVDAARPFRVVRVGGRTQIETEIRSRLGLVWQMLQHDVTLVNGLEYAAYQAAVITRSTYIAKVVGDTVWEAARNNGLTTFDIDRFQSADLVDSYLNRLRVWRSRFLSRAKLVITPSEYLRRLVTGWGVPDAQIRVIPNGIPRKTYADKAPPRRNPGEKLKIVFVGRLTNWKGVETMLLAVSKMKEVECIIIGDGPEYPIFYALAHQLGLEDVRFLGRLDPADVCSVMDEMHVLVLVSAYEGLSHTLIEASARGLAIVASNCGGNPEIIKDGYNGLLVPYGDVDALLSALRMLQESEELRFRLAVNAQQSCSRFDFDNTVEAVRRLLIQ